MRLTPAEIAQSVERLTSEREVAGSIPGMDILYLGSLNNCEMKVLSLPCKQLDLRAHGSHDHVKWRSRLQ